MNVVRLTFGAPTAQPLALPDERLALVEVEDIGEDDHERPARLPAAVEGERVVVVGLGLAGHDRPGGVEKTAQLRGARSWRAPPSRTSGTLIFQDFVNTLGSWMVASYWMVSASSIVYRSITFIASL